MKISIKYEPIGEDHINSAVDLVLSAYNEEKKSIPFLPHEQGFLSSLQESVRNLFKNGTGIAAVYNNKLIGFIAGFEVDELFGECKGIWSPLYGHGAIKEHRSDLYIDLYKHVADLWVKKSCFNHVITLFPHDKETINTWFWLGFGLRCVDAIREVKPIEDSNPDIIIHKASIDDIPSMASLDKFLNQYMNQSPMFMPRNAEDPVKDLTEWLENQNHHLWVAYRDEKPLGYMSIQPTAETFVSEHSDVMNVTGAYVMNDARGSNIGGALLGTIQQWLIQNGYPLCGVDFESFNVSGSHFWTKHFTPYTYSVVRRIDERIRF